MNTECGNRFYSEHKFGGKSEKELTKKMFKYPEPVRTDIISRLKNIESRVSKIKSDYEDISSVYIPYPQAEKLNENDKAISAWYIWRRYLNPFISLGGPLLIWIMIMYIYNYFRGMSCSTTWVVGSICKFVFGVNSFENISMISGIIAVISFGFFVMSAKHSIEESICMSSLKSRMESLHNFMEETREEYEDLVVLAHTGKCEDRLRGCEQITGYGNIGVNIWKVVSRFEMLEASIGRIDVCLSRCEKILSKKKIASAVDTK
jgi:hypothetical protein